MNTLDTAIHALRQGIKDCDKEIKQFERQKKQLTKALISLGIDAQSNSNVRVTNKRAQPDVPVAGKKTRRQQMVEWVVNQTPGVIFTGHDAYNDLHSEDPTLTIHRAQTALWELMDQGLIEKVGHKMSGQYMVTTNPQVNNVT